MMKFEDFARAIKTEREADLILVATKAIIKDQIRRWLLSDLQSRGLPING